jgi:hypothetical protein
LEAPGIEMSGTEISIVVGLVFLVASNIARFLLLDRWLEKLNVGLPAEQHFQLLGWWWSSENMRAWRRWREIKKKRSTHF